MTTETEAALCGRALGTKASPELYGKCTKELGHPASCSSPELREYRRKATQASRSKKKSIDDPDDADEFVCDHTTCVKPCMFAGIPYPSERQIAAEKEREAREAAAWEKEKQLLLQKPHKYEPPVDMQVWLRMAHPAMTEYKAQAKKWSTGLP